MFYENVWNIYWIRTNIYSPLYSVITMQIHTYLSNINIWRNIYFHQIVYSYKHVHKVLKTYDSQLKCVEILFQMFIFIITIEWNVGLSPYLNMCLWDKHHMLRLHFRKNNMLLFEFENTIIEVGCNLLT